MSLNHWPETRPRYKKNLESGSFIFPAFQPMVPFPWTGDDEVIYEMLARFESPDGLILQPDEFIGQIVPQHEVDTAMLQLIPEVQRHHPIKLSLNCSPSSLCSKAYFERLRSMILGQEIDSRRLMLEITEHHLDAGSDIELMDRVDEIRDHGVHVALDDFGSGGSGIARLSACHFDMIKVSPGLDITSTRGRIIIENLVDMVGKLSSAGDGHMTLTIEGLENEHQIGVANFIGANYGQGHGIVMPSEQIISPEYALHAIGKTVSGSLMVLT